MSSSPPRWRHVPYLPQGVKTTQVNGVTYYEWNNVQYTAKIVSGEVVYTAR